MRKAYILLGGTAACAVLLLAVARPVHGPVIETGATGKAADGREVAESAPRHLTLAFAGDVMLARAIEKTVQNAGRGDYSYPYALMDGTLRDADIAFANLETSVSRRGTNVGSIYSFRSNPDALPALKAAGIDAVSIANNHIWDWGRDAFADTMAHLDQAGIVHAGGGMTYAEAHEPKLIEKDGYALAFLAYTDLLPQFLLRENSSPSVAFPTEAALKADVARAKELGADVVIASFHWGEEYKTAHNAYQERMAKAAIDAGAHIVMGHHPHTPQEVESYKDGLIIYSLGNFIFDQNFDELTRTGLIVRVTLGPEGRIVSHESITIEFNDRYQPYRKSAEAGR